MLRRDLGCDKEIWFAKWVNLSSELSLWVMFWALFKLVFMFILCQTLGPPNPMDIPDHFQVSFFPQVALLFTVRSSSSFWYHSHCAPIFTDLRIVQAAFNNRSGSIEHLLRLSPEAEHQSGPQSGRKWRPSHISPRNQEQMIFLKESLKINCEEMLTGGAYVFPAFRFAVFSLPWDVLLPVDMWWVLLMYSKLLFKRMYVFRGKSSQLSSGVCRDASAIIM